MTPTAKQAAGMTAPPAAPTANEKVKALRARIKAAQKDLDVANAARDLAKATHDKARETDAETRKLILASAGEVKHTRGLYEAAHDVVDAKTRALMQLTGELASLGAPLKDPNEK